MSRSYWTISDWSLRSREDPAAAAHHFYQHLKSLPPDQARSAIAKTLKKEELIRRFEESASQSESPLSGVPYLLKDLYDVAGWNTTASSLFLSEIRPAPEKSSALAEAFSQAGGVFAGKTHLVEFAYGMEGSNSHFGDGVHPHFPDRVSGGSSSGSVWAVASGLVPVASGSDTGGSVRVPAAYNGLYGLRVTPDHPWSKQGCFPLSPSYDTAGWFTRTSEDMAITIEALFDQGEFENTDLRGIDLLPNYKFLDEGLSIPHQGAVADLPVRKESAMSDAFSRLPDPVQPYLAISSNEAFNVHKNWLDERKEEYDPQTWERIDKGRHRTDEELTKSREVQHQFQRFFDDLFSQFDFAVLPAAPVPAPTPQDSTALREAHLQLTAPGSLAQIPILTLPYFMESGLSGGLQVIVPDLSARSLAIWKSVLNDR